MSIEVANMVIDRKTLPKPDGVLLQSPESRHGGKVFFCSRGKRHWVMNAEWFAENGFVWPDDLQIVSPTVIDAFIPGQRAPMRWTDAVRNRPPRDSTGVMREIAVARLSGTGIEVGAGASPMPIPIDCVVRYADIFTLQELRQHWYDGQDPSDLMPPDIVASFDDMSAVPDASVDFVVACHVIEHVSDPIAALENNWAKLRPGGSLVLVVPDMTRTFDRHRELTTIGHLMDDNANPQDRRVRDRLHFREFYRVAFPTPEDEYEATWRRKWAVAFPIHYHTWTYDSFSELIDTLTAPRGRLAGATVWSQPPLGNEAECNEFWFALTKARTG
jgi:SAM-dependent methyltransferase